MNPFSVTARCSSVRRMAILFLAPTLTGFAATTNTLVMPATLPDTSGSVARILASLAFVLALFFGGVWLFRNWQRLAQSHRRTGLNVLEARSLGPRQALYVISYEHQRFLVGASQAGISLISPLPPAAIAEPAPVLGSTPSSPFAEALRQTLGRS